MSHAVVVVDLAAVLAVVVLAASVVSVGSCDVGIDANFLWHRIATQDCDSPL